MKTAIKVLTILSLIGSALSILGLSISLITFEATKEFVINYIDQLAASDPNLAAVFTQELINLILCISITSIIVGLIWAIVAVINDSFILIKLNKNATKKQLLAHAILSLIFSNFVSGILLLIVKDEQL